MSSQKSAIFFVSLLVFSVFIVSIMFAVPVLAAICGGLVPCSCGDDINESITLTDDLVCDDEDYVLYVDEEDVTINCDGHLLSESGEGVYDYVIYSDYDNTTVENCVIDDFSWEIYAIFFEDSGYHTVQNNSISNISDGTGIYFYEVYGSVIDGNSITENYDGIDLESVVDSNITFNEIVDNDDNGLDMEDVDDSIVDSNNLSYNDYNLESEYGEGNIFSNNFISYGDDDVGFYISESEDETITNNTISNNDYGGLYIYSSYYMNVTGNNILYNNDDGEYAGLYLDDFYESIVSGNLIESNVYYGVYIDDGDYINFTDNIIANNTGTGIDVEYVDDSLFAGNSIVWNNFDDEGDGGFYVYESEDNNFTDNNVSNNYRSGLEVRYSEDNVFRGNSINRNNDSTGLYVYESYYNEFYDNVVNDNIDSDGLRIRYGEENIFVGNEFNGNDEEGIDEDNSYNNEYVNNTAQDNGGSDFWSEGDASCGGEGFCAESLEGYEGEVVNLDIGTAVISFIYKYIALKGASSDADAPEGLVSVGNQFVEVEETSGEGAEDSYFYLNFTYSDSDVAEITEDTVQVAKYEDDEEEGSWDTNQSEFVTEEYGLNPSENYAYVNMEEYDVEGLYSLFGVAAPAPAPVSSGGGGGGSGHKLGCLMEWACSEWTECSADGTQERACENIRLECKTYIKEPSEEQTCTVDTSSGSSNITELGEEPQTAGVTGAVIGTLQSGPVLWLIVFLGLVGGAYVYMLVRKK